MGVISRTSALDFMIGCAAVSRQSAVGGKNKWNLLLRTDLPSVPQNLRFTRGLVAGVLDCAGQSEAATAFRRARGAGSSERVALALATTVQKTG